MKYSRSIEDVRSIRKDLTEKQAEYVLHICEHSDDFVTDDTIRETAQVAFPNWSRRSTR